MYHLNIHFNMKSLKIHLIIVLLLMCITSLHSQSISIELSVKWENGTDVYNENSIIYVPKLSITYRNNSDTNYYFTNLCVNCKNGIMLPSGLKIQHPEFQKITNIYADNLVDDYNVDIGSIDDWVILNNNKVYGTTLCVSISKFYKILRIKKELEDIETSDYCEPIKSDRIIDPQNCKLIFLKSGEIKTDEYSLIGFQLFKGSFNFYISPDSLKDYIYTRPIGDKNQPMIKTALPKEVGEYKLYSGKFNTNKISITF